MRSLRDVEGQRVRGDGALTVFIIPTLHPNNIMRQNMKSSGLVELGVKRAADIARGVWKPKWVDEEKIVILRPDAETVTTVLRSMHGKKVAFDVETDGRHVLKCDLRCIAFYDGERAICVPLLRRTGNYDDVMERAEWVDFYTGATKIRVLKALKELLQNCTLLTQNGQYDRAVVHAQTGIRVPSGFPHFDTIIGHHLVAPYLPHGLGLLAALYTESPYYKATAGGDAWSSESDHELWLYNARDVIVTWQVAMKMMKEVHELPQHPALYEHDAWQEGQCEAWREAGVALDPYALRFFQSHYRSVMGKAMTRMRGVVKEIGSKSSDEALVELLDKLEMKAIKRAEKEGIEAIEDFDADGSGRTVELFNPASLNQLRTLLHAIGIPLSEKTATGQLSTKREVLTGIRKELLEKGVKDDDVRVAFLDYLFAWRESSKVDGTYLQPELLNGRVHPTFSMHVVPTGRLNSSNPNFQNQPPEIRGMYVADEDHELVYEDWDALEMRLGAYNSEDKNFIEVFRAYDAGEGPKPHIVNMSVIFGLPATKEAAEKNPAQYTAAKTFAYAAAYGAGPTTQFEQAREAMPDLNFKTFMVALGRYKKQYQRLFQFQQEVVTQGCTKGYLDSPILKRRVYFFERGYGESSPEATAMQNFPYQSGGSDVVQLANRRVEEGLVKPWQKKLRKGEKLVQLAQVHDELLFLVPKRLVADFKVELKRLSEIEVRRGWKLPVDVKSATRWKPVKSRCTECGDATEMSMTSPDVWEGVCSKKHRVKVEVML